MMLLIFALPDVRADEFALVRVGETWRFFKGVRQPPTGIADWRLPDFDDRSWEYGPSGFSHGMGLLNDEATPLSDMYGKYVTVYLRKAFTVQEPAQIKWLVLRINYNRGFAAYLNGQEVARRGLPGEPGQPLSFDQPATLQLKDNITEEINISQFIPRLRPGTNVLAIEGHSSGIEDYEFTINAELCANVIRGPLISPLNAELVRVAWRTPAPVIGRVEYGTNAEPGKVVTEQKPTTNHLVLLPRLLPGTRYYYRIGGSSAGGSFVSGIETFVTFKTNGSLAFTVFGDSGAGTIEQYRIAKLVRDTAPDLVLHTGDVVYNAFQNDLADLRCLSVYQPHMKSVPYFFTFGNHDFFEPGTIRYNMAIADRNYLHNLPLPANTVTRTAHFYSFDHGDAHFVCLFVPSFMHFAKYPLRPGSLQYRWLSDDLAQSRKPWKILFFHIPVRSSGVHRMNDLDYNDIPDQVELQRTVLPLARQHGVQLIFNGHEHFYERFNPVQGVVSIISGGGGAYLYTPRVYSEPASAFAAKVFHCVRVGITNDTAFIQAIDINGTIIDSTTVPRRQP